MIGGQPEPESPRRASATSARDCEVVPIDVQSADPALLFDRWRQFHDERAREALAERFLPLARSLARRYAKSSVPLEDLVQIASYGLVKAIDRFDPARGLAFSSFAVPTILGELKRHFRDAGWAVHVPRSDQERAHEVEKAVRQLSGQTGRSPTPGELARYLHLSEEQVLEGLETAQAYTATSLDAPRGSADDSSESYLDQIGADDPDLGLVDESVSLGAAIRQLPTRERTVLHLRFVDDLTQTEIAERIGVSQMQVSRLLRGALQHLRELTKDTASLKRRDGFV